MFPDFRFVEPKPGVPVVVLDFATEPEPDDAEGKTRCTMTECQAWLWLDSNTFPLVSSGHARPICGPCMQQIHDEHPSDVRLAGDASTYLPPLGL